MTSIRRIGSFRTKFYHSRHSHRIDSSQLSEKTRKFHLQPPLVDFQQRTNIQAKKKLFELALLREYCRDRRNCQNLHAKCYLNDSNCIIASMNLTILAKSTILVDHAIRVSLGFRFSEVFV